MILTAKKAQKKVQSGELKTLAHWDLSQKEMSEYNKQQSKENFRAALAGALVLPGIFMLLAIGNLFVEQDTEFLLMMIKFAVLFFLLIYPLSYWGQWRKSRSLRNSSEAFFGENWFLFGKAFVRWKGLISFKGCEIDHTRQPKVISISIVGSGKGRVQQSFSIPIPEDKLNEAEELVKRYKN